MQQVFHVMAAGETKLPPISDVRAAVTEVSNAAKSLSEILQDGPLKVKCLEIHTGMTTTLAGLPKDDAAPETIKPEPIITDLLRTLNSAQGLMVQVKAGMANELCAMVDREICSRIAKGSLMTPEDHNSKVEAAKQDCHQGMMEHMKLYGQRRQALASANIPAPEDEVLLLPEDKYKPRFDAATMRIKKLEPFAASLGVDRMNVLAWKADDASFNAAADALSTVTPPAQKKETPPNIFENSKHGSAGAAAERVKFIGACM